MFCDVANLVSALVGFLLSLTPLSCQLMGWRGAGGNGAATIAAYLFFGGLLMIVGGFLEVSIAPGCAFCLLLTFDVVDHWKHIPLCSFHVVWSVSCFNLYTSHHTLIPIRRLLAHLCWYTSALLQCLWSLLKEPGNGPRGRS